MQRTWSSISRERGSTSPQRSKQRVPFAGLAKRSLDVRCCSGRCELRSKTIDFESKRGFLRGAPYPRWSVLSLSLSSFCRSDLSSSPDLSTSPHPELWSSRILSFCFFPSKTFFPISLPLSLPPTLVICADILASTQSGCIPCGRCCATSSRPRVKRSA